MARHPRIVPRRHGHGLRRAGRRRRDHDRAQGRRAAVRGHLHQDGHDPHRRRRDGEQRGVRVRAAERDAAAGRSAAFAVAAAGPCSAAPFRAVRAIRAARAARAARNTRASRRACAVGRACAARTGAAAHGRATRDHTGRSVHCGERGRAGRRAHVAAAGAAGAAATATATFPALTDAPTASRGKARIRLFVGGCSTSARRSASSTGSSALFRARDRRTTLTDGLHRSAGCFVFEGDAPAEWGVRCAGTSSAGRPARVSDGRGLERPRSAW